MLSTHPVVNKPPFISLGGHTTCSLSNSEQTLLPRSVDICKTLSYEIDSPNRYSLSTALCEHE